MNQTKKEQAVTLIALVVTLVTLIILAAVSINMVLGDQGIFKKAQEGANSMYDAEVNTQIGFNTLIDAINNINDEKVVDIATVTTTEHETLKAKDSYGNIVTVPKGFKVVTTETMTVPEGIVIEDANGNQFVWIAVGTIHKDNNPENDVTVQLGRYIFDKTTGQETLKQSVEDEGYKKLVDITNENGETFQEYATRENANGLLDNENRENDLNAIAKNLEHFVTSVENNGGYYIARYEASYGEGSNVTDWKPLSKVSTGTPRGIDDSEVELTQGMLWNYVTQLEASKICQNMYSDNTSVGVESDLMNSYEWDTTIVFVQKMNELNSNYANASRETTGNSNLLNTGETSDIVCNIYDLAANLGELTTEYCSMVRNNVATTCGGRSGCYYYSNGYTAFRGAGGIIESGNHYNGFRPILYIK